MNMSSSVLNPPKTFSCNENNLKQYQSTYKKTLLREKRARVLLKKIESEIEKLKKTDPENQWAKKQNEFRVLSRQIAVYNRFIQRYDTCKKEITLMPSVWEGIMSWEAKIDVSDRPYQALAAFQISSPDGLDTYIQSLQFAVEIVPDLGLVIDKWFLLHEGFDSLPCQLLEDKKTLECELIGNMPLDIASGKSRQYWIGAHIVSVHGSGMIDIQLKKIQFNKNRIYTLPKDIGIPVRFGTPVVIDEPLKENASSLSDASNNAPHSTESSESSTDSIKGTDWAPTTVPQNTDTIPVVVWDTSAVWSEVMPQDTSGQSIVVDTPQTTEETGQM